MGGFRTRLLGLMAANIGWIAVGVCPGADDAAVDSHVEPPPLIEHYEGQIGHLAWTTDGKTLTSIAGLGRDWSGPTTIEMRTWNTASWLAAAHAIPDAKVWASAVTADGKLAALGGEGLAIWDLRSGKQIAGVEKVPGGVHAIAFSPCGTCGRGRLSRSWTRRFVARFEGTPVGSRRWRSAPTARRWPVDATMTS